MDAVVSCRKCTAQKEVGIAFLETGYDNDVTLRYILKKVEKNKYQVLVRG